MVKRYVHDHMYFGGAVRAPGDVIQVENQADLKTLEARGLVGEAAPASKAERGAPANKIEKAPLNKAGAGATRSKQG